MHGSFTRFAITLVFGVVIGASHLTAEIVIDNFTFGTDLTQVGVGTATQTSNDSSILGGARDESVTVRDLGGAEFFGFVGYGSGLALGQSTDDQVHGFFTYDDFSGLDLTEGGVNDHFLLNFASVDTVIEIPDVFSITVISGATTQTVGFAMPGNTNLPADVQVAFTEFTTIDFSNVDSIQFSYDFLGNPGRDFTLSGFSATAIPEPTGIVSLLLMGSLLAMRRRKS